MQHARIAVAHSRTSPPPAAAGIVRRFLVWAQRAGEAERADAASALARAYLHTELPGALRKDIAVVLAALLDDPHPGVRRALSEAFAGARGRRGRSSSRWRMTDPRSPRRSSPDPPCLPTPNSSTASRPGTRGAMRRRATASPRRRSVRRIGRGRDAEAALVLLDNFGAALTPGSLHRLFERFGDDADFRLALIARSGLPAILEADLAIATADALRGAAARSASWRAARDAAIVAIAAGRRDDELPNSSGRCARAAR